MKLKAISVAIATVLTVGAPLAQAQILEEVMVTAQKREQSANDIGISVFLQPCLRVSNGYCSISGQSLSCSRNQLPAVPSWRVLVQIQSTFSIKLMF